MFVSTNAGVSIYDGESGELLSVKTSSRGSFSDLDVSPSGRYLYVADFGGESASGTPIEPSFIHRCDVITDEWQLQRSLKTVYEVRAVDDARVISLEQNPHVDATLNLWIEDRAVLTELDQVSGNHQSNMEFNPRTALVYFGDNGVSPPSIDVFRVVGNELVFDHDFRSIRAPFVLSVDETHLYHGTTQRDATKISSVIRQFPETMTAEAGQLAFSPSRIYNAATGALIGELPVEGSFFSMTPDGRHLWMFDYETPNVHHIEIR